MDEIGEINQTVQVKLLRVLEERVIEHVGSNIPINVDIRVIAATNKKLSEEIKEGKSQNQISKEYGISRYAIQSWIGARPEKNVLPKQRGRKPAKHCKNTNMKTSV